MAAKRSGTPTRAIGRSERAALVGLITGRARKLDAERSLDELAGLAQAAGAEVVLQVRAPSHRALLDAVLSSVTLR